MEPQFPVDFDGTQFVSFEVVGVHKGTEETQP